MEIPEADEHETAEAFGKDISAEVWLPKDDSQQFGKVLRRKRDADGNLIGKHNSNPILDTSVDEVQFPGGQVEAFAANVIAEYIYAQVDEEGHQHLVLDDIIDHRKDGSAVSGDDAEGQGGPLWLFHILFSLSLTVVSSK